VIDALVAGKKSSPEVNKKFQAIIYKLDGTILLKPQTFMNLSGVSVVSAVNFYKIDLNDLLVIHDDVDFELGEVKHQYDRSSAGNKGVESIIKALNSQAFHRLRLGIGHSVSSETSDHVLDKFKPEEKEVAQRMVERATEVVLNWIIDSGK
jgi:PTH1 family peptidyl-tRNA hydrolase